MKKMDECKMCYVARDVNNENHESVSKQRRVTQKKKKNKKNKTKKRKFFYTPVLRVANYERNGWVKDVLRCKGRQQ